MEYFSNMFILQLQKPGLKFCSGLLLHEQTTAVEYVVLTVEVPKHCLQKVRCRICYRTLVFPVIFTQSDLLFMVKLHMTCDVMALKSSVSGTGGK